MSGRHSRNSLSPLVHHSVITAVSGTGTDKLSVNCWLCRPRRAAGSNSDSVYSLLRTLRLLHEQWRFRLTSAWRMLVVYLPETALPPVFNIVVLMALYPGILSDNGPPSSRTVFNYVTLFFIVMNPFPYPLNNALYRIRWHPLPPPPSLTLVCKMPYETVSCNLTVY